MAGEAGASRNLDQTATWAVAGVCAIIIIISIALEKLLHKVGAVRNIFFALIGDMFEFCWDEQIYHWFLLGI